jgi:hypothetical protein
MWAGKLVYMEITHMSELYVTDDWDINAGEVQLPCFRNDFRGEPWRVICVSRAPSESSTGRVVARRETREQEFFPSVFGLTIKERA